MIDRGLHISIKAIGLASPDEAVDRLANYWMNKAMHCRTPEIAVACVREMVLYALGSQENPAMPGRFIIERAYAQWKGRFAAIIQRCEMEAVGGLQ